MKNVNVEVKGDMLVIKIDLTKDFGLSKSGKTRIIASTEGNMVVDKEHNIRLGLNLFK